MLRISAHAVAGGSVTLRLDGQITGQWVKLLQGTCEARMRQGARIVIDLRHVSFVDREGLALLRSLAEHQVEIVNALPFIAAQIGKTKP